MRNEREFSVSDDRPAQVMAAEALHTGSVDMITKTHGQATP